MTEEPKTHFSVERDGLLFVRLWQAASCPLDVAEELGLTEPAARQIAVRLRRKGVKLKRFRSVMSDEDYAKLAATVKPAKRVS